MKKQLWKFSNFFTAYPSLASSHHWLQPYLDAPGCCQFSDDLILIVLINIQSLLRASAVQHFIPLVRNMRASQLNYIKYISDNLIKLNEHKFQFQNWIRMKVLSSKLLSNVEKMILTKLISSPLLSCEIVINCQKVSMGK